MSETSESRTTRALLKASKPGGLGGDELELYVQDSESVLTLPPVTYPANRVMDVANAWLTMPGLTVRVTSPELKIVRFRATSPSAITTLTDAITEQDAVEALKQRLLNNYGEANAEMYENERIDADPNGAVADVNFELTIVNAATKTLRTVDNLEHLINLSLTTGTWAQEQQF
jgi:hypothetical protein